MLSDWDTLFERGGKYTGCRRPIKEACKHMIDQIYGLQEGGATALGPAVCKVIFQFIDILLYSL